MSDFMNDVTELNFDDIHFTSLAQDLCELAEESVLKGGTYNGQVTEIKGTVTASEGDRQGATLKVQLFNDEGQKLRSVRVKVSWEKRIVNGRVDKKFRMFAALRKALEVTELDPREVLMAAQGAALRVSVAEAYLVADSDAHEAHAERQANSEGEIWAFIREGDEGSDEQRQHYLALGYETKSFAQGVYAA